MARTHYASGTGDTYAIPGVDGDYELPAAATYEVYTAATGGSHHTDLLTHAGAATSNITPDAQGRAMFYGVDGYVGEYWVDAGGPDRYRVHPDGMPERIKALEDASPGVGVTDGDKGDVTVSVSGTVWEIDAGAVGATELADNAVTNAKLADNAVGNAELADNAVGTAEIAANAVTTAKIADSQITNAKMADDAVGSAEIAANAVGTTEIADNAVTNAKLADNAVGNAELADNAVTTAELADNAVTNAKLADNAVNTAEIADHAVTLAKNATVATAIILGRVTAGTGDIEPLSATQVRTLLNVADGATATTTEVIQDIVGAQLVEGAKIDLTYDDTAGTTTIAVLEPTPRTITGAATLAAGDTNAALYFTGGSAAILTVPTNAAVGFATDTQVEVWALGAGALTITASATVTLNGVSAGSYTPAQYSRTVLRKTGTNAWAASGGGSTVGTLATVVDGTILRCPWNGSAWTYAGTALTDRPSTRTGIFFQLTGAPYATADPSWMLVGDDRVDL